MNKNQKGFANIALVIVIVILAGAVGYFALRKTGPITQGPTPTPTKIVVSKTPTMTPDKTAGWKTYASTKYGFEIKYPSDWVAPILSEQSNNTSGINLSFMPKNSQGFDIQMVNVGTFVSQGSIEKNVSVFNQNYKEPWEKEITISNGKAFYYISDTKSGPSPTAYLVGSSGVWLIGADDINLKDTLLNMVSTFKFTK